MTIELFSFEKIDLPINERKQYERIKTEMVDKFSKGTNRYCVIIDYIIGNKQYDIIVIKEDAIILIELKGYKGKIIGSENNTWHVETDNNELIEIDQEKNPFLQVREQRYKLLYFLNDKLPHISERFKDEKIYNVAAIICFENGSTYDIEQIDHKINLWFNVTDESNLFELIEQTTSNEFLLKNIEIDALLKEMNLQKLDVKMNKETLKISNKTVLSTEDIISITNRILEDFKSVEFSYIDLSEIVDPEVGARYLKEAIEKKILLKNETTNNFSLAEKWSDNLPEIIENEDLLSGNDLSKYTKKDFWLRQDNVKSGEEYQGVYRGTTYHTNFKKNVWWTTGKDSIKIKMNFSNEDILDKILEIKPQGGSFRITEAKEILTKIYFEDRGYVSIYIGKLIGEIEFENYRWNPNGIKRGDLWPSIYDGTTFSVNGNKELLMHIGDKKVYAIEGAEELVKKVLEFKGRGGGGRFKVNENGCILTLMYKAPYPDNIKRQIGILTEIEKNLIDIRKKTERDEMVPIYVGKFKGNIKFKKMFDIHEKWTKEEDEEFLSRLGC